MPNSIPRARTVALASIATPSSAHGRPRGLRGGRVMRASLARVLAVRRLWGRRRGRQGRRRWRAVFQGTGTGVPSEKSNTFCEEQYLNRKHVSPLWALLCTWDNGDLRVGFVAKAQQVPPAALGIILGDPRGKATLQLARAASPQTPRHSVERTLQRHENPPPQHLNPAHPRPPRCSITRNPSTHPQRSLLPPSAPPPPPPLLQFSNIHRPPQPRTKPRILITVPLLARPPPPHTPTPSYLARGSDY